MKEKCPTQCEVIYLPCRQNNDFFPKRKQNKIEVDTRPGGDGIHNSVYGHEQILALNHLFVPQAKEGDFQ